MLLDVLLGEAGTRGSEGRRRQDPAHGRTTSGTVFEPGLIDFLAALEGIATQIAMSVRVRLVQVGWHEWIIPDCRTRRLRTAAQPLTFPLPVLAASLIHG